MVPSEVSPVLLTNIVVTLASGYTGTLATTTTHVKLYGVNVIESGVTYANYERDMYVYAVDDTAKTLTFKFPGSPLRHDSYRFEVRTDAEGILDSTALALTVKGEVTEYTPKEGSLLGGTLITITGAVFSTVTTDNTIQVGGENCIVESTTATEIKCRLVDLALKTND